jgi:hypothetical protein
MAVPLVAGATQVLLPRPLLPVVRTRGAVLMLAVVAADGRLYSPAERDITTELCYDAYTTGHPKDRGKITMMYD